MQAVRVMIQLHRMAEVLLKFGPSTHEDTNCVLRAVTFPSAAESCSATVGELKAEIDCVTK